MADRPVRTTMAQFVEIIETLHEHYPWAPHLPDETVLAWYGLLCHLLPDELVAAAAWWCSRAKGDVGEPRFPNSAGDIGRAVRAIRAEREAVAKKKLEEEAKKREAEERAKLEAEEKARGELHPRSRMAEFARRAYEALSRLKQERPGVDAQTLIGDEYKRLLEAAEWAWRRRHIEVVREPGEDDGEEKGDEAAA